MIKIAFVQEELRDRFSVMILSAVLKKNGHSCDVFIAEAGEDIVSSLMRYKPDIIGFSTMSPGIDFALKTARQLKKTLDSFIIMGGSHPTFYPEVINEDCLDAICIGEGEYALLELADRIDSKKDFSAIWNLWIKQKGKIFKNELRDLVALNSLPAIDRGIYFDKYAELKNAPTKKIAVGRGCPFSCTYCFNSALKKMYEGKGKYVRFLDVDKVIAEIKDIKEKYGAKWIQIITDTINIDKKWFMSFLESYKKEIDIPFLCNVRIDLIDEEMVKKMKDARCDRVDYGLEHGDEWIRRNILKRNMSNEQIITAGKLFNKYKIRVQTTNIIGVPHETVDSALKTVWLNRSVKPEVAHSYILQPYAGTEIHRYAMENGFLDPCYGFSKSGNTFQVEFDGAAISVPLKLKETRQLINIFLFFDLLVKHRWLEPIIRRLIRMPPNKFFKFIYVLPMVRRDIKYSESRKKKIAHIVKLLKIFVRA